MKIRIGVGFGGWPFERTQDFWDFVDVVEESGLDSIWINDRIRNPAPALERVGDNDRSSHATMLDRRNRHA